ncbi:hypothetical protein ABZ345_35720 [Lentzea sp. NPDC005914]|uniref:hypothetical protein n=1 Tax=Lentzea sp. NPDC005914 TaxID=3154572 RepID=UPI0033C9F7A6
MGSLWSALIGALAALIGVWVTQALTNQREFQRDQLKWSQERQQRELDSQRAAFAACLLAFDKWHTEAYVLSMHLLNSAFRRGDASKFPELEEASRSGLVAVELVCSDEAIEATRKALSAVFGMSFAVKMVDSSARHDGKVDDGLRHQANEAASRATDAMADLRKVYRTELAKLTAEPVVLPHKPRKTLSLPWRKSA